MNRFIYALILLVIGGLFPSVSSADEISLGIGQMANNVHKGNGAFLNAIARKSDVLGPLEWEVSFTQVDSSSFGDHHGSLQLLETGFNSVFRINEDWEFRIGVGIIPALHYSWATYTGEKGMQPQTFYTAECIFCGWNAKGSVKWRWVEFGVEYTSTDPNVWTSYNGHRYRLSGVWEFGLDRDDGRAFFSKEERELPVVKAPAEVAEAPSVRPSAACSPPAQLEAENKTEPRRMTGPI